MRVLAILLVTLAGCHRPAPAVPPASDRMDAPLRRHLAAISPDQPIDVLIGVGTADVDAVRRGLAAAGIDVRAVSGGVAVGRGVRAAVERAASLPFVGLIELSQTRPPTTGRP